MQNEIEFTKEKYDRLKKQYKEAKEKGHSTFTFQGNELDLGYAKYLIEYLSMKFEPKNL